MSLLYHSTRSDSPLLTSKQALLTGLSSDGGLFICDELLEMKDSAASLVEQTLQLTSKGTPAAFQETAQAVLALLLDDYSEDELAHCVNAAYGPNFEDEKICPVSPVGDAWLLELYHGPTAAFKDVALQILPQLLRFAQGSYAPDETTLIVTATSGDTGKAALSGFADVARTGICVFYPAAGVSDIQRLQMTTQTGNNVFVCGVEGNFDDVQSEVKRIFNNAELSTELAQRSISLSSANSINIGRLVPQITYYINSYAQLVECGTIEPGDELEYIVPTGNFGDILAGYYAKLLGLPISKLVVASNKNDVLHDFFETGVYNRERAFFKTISPSMDILISSNLERLLYLATAQVNHEKTGDTERVAAYMEQLSCEGSFEVEKDLLAYLQENFASGMATEDDTRYTIKRTFTEEGVLIDPHTAVAKHVLDERRTQGMLSGKAQVCLSTASPYKFSADVLEALHGTKPIGNGFACMRELFEVSGMPVPRALSSLETAPVRHSDVCPIHGIQAFVEEAAVTLCG